MHKKTLILTLLLICFMLTAPLPIKAAMRINGITLPDISSISSSQIGDLSYVLDDADDYKIFFTSLDSSFTIRLYQNSTEVTHKAEQRVLQLLQIAPFEACWLPIRVYVAGSEGLPVRPGFCNQERRADINADTEVNSVDYTTCITQVENPPSPAACDIDQDKQVSALDISLVLTYLGRRDN